MLDEVRVGEIFLLIFRCLNVALHISVIGMDYLCFERQKHFPALHMYLKRIVLGSVQESNHEFLGEASTTTTLVFDVFTPKNERNHQPVGLAHSRLISACYVSVCMQREAIDIAIKSAQW